MLSAAKRVRVWAYPRPCDLRRGYNGLYALTRNHMGHDPRSGDLFIFLNRSRTACKILLHDGSGLCIFMKRLDKGRFAALWLREQDGQVRLTQPELALFLEGCVEVGYRRISPERGADDTA